MAAYFFDSSALVKRHAKEAGTTWMVGLFRQASTYRFYAARITRVEVTAALIRKQRGGYLTTERVRRALTRMRREFDSRIFSIDVTPALVQEAETLSERHGLRGYDAVQLAAALEANTERIAAGLTPLVLVAADRELLTAAAAEGLHTDNPELH